MKGLRRGSFLRFVAAVPLAAWSMRAMADFPFLSPAEMAEQSDLICVGLYLGAASIRPDPDRPDWNLGVIEIVAVLKGDAAATVALLRLPPTRPPGMVASADVALTAGQHGLWYLRAAGDGSYRLDRPDRFVPMDQVESRIRALSGG